MNRSFLDFPFAIDGRGRSATTNRADHVRDLIVQLLFTDPGERVNRPEFGCGVRRLVFMPDSTALAGATGALLRASLQAHLDAYLIVDDVQAEADEEVLRITVAYTERVTGDRRVVQVTRP